MTVSRPFIEPAGLHVTVDRVVHQRLATPPPERPHCFVYFITIHNDTDLTITIKGRKWVVTDSVGQVTAVEGEGVVGEFPVIPPDGKFTYNSFHLIATPEAVAEGSYLGLDSMGRTVVVRIPSFRMRLPADD